MPAALRTCRHCDLKAYNKEDLLSFRSDRAQPYNRQNQCKECQKKRGREWSLFSKYGMTEVDYEQMLEDQDYSCAICATKKTTHRYGVFNVDHCHETGNVRALLCNALIQL